MSLLRGSPLVTDEMPERMTARPPNCWPADPYPPPLGARWIWFADDMPCLVSNDGKDWGRAERFHVKQS